LEKTPNQSDKAGTITIDGNFAIGEIVIVTDQSGQQFVLGQWKATFDEKNEMHALQ
jgi:hypothetical protein